MDHGFSRSQEPWELSDGAVYLLRELSTTNKADLLFNYLEKVWLFLNKDCRCLIWAELITSSIQLF